MKAITLFATGLFFTILSFGQDANYKGPGKVEVQSFWRQSEIFKNGKGSETTLGNMKRSLENLKQKDPSYNAGAMEEEYKKWKKAHPKAGFKEFMRFVKAATLAKYKKSRLPGFFAKFKCKKKAAARVQKTARSRS
jgi:hypothetical protein